jgi:hypothetical protein
VPVAYRNAQTSGEIRDVSAKNRVALQQYLTLLLHHVSFSLHFRRLTDILSVAEKVQTGFGYFFAMKMAAFIHRRYMSLLVMLMH